MNDPIKAKSEGEPGNPSRGFTPNAARAAGNDFREFFLDNDRSFELKVAHM